VLTRQLHSVCYPDWVGKEYHRVATNLENLEYSWNGILREFCATSGKTDFVLWVQPVSSNPYAAIVYLVHENCWFQQYGTTGSC